jgi:hypothetical protein
MEKFYIFLDIDGVLNTFSSKSKANGRRINLSIHPLAHLHTKPLTTFTDFLKTVDHKIQIVISSSWRIAFNKEEFDIMAKESPEFNYIWGLVDKGSWRTEVSSTKGLDRGYEIEDYVIANKVKHYIILDDNEDMLDYQLKRHFIKTNLYCGVDAVTVKKLNEVLSATYSGTLNT